MKNNQTETYKDLLKKFELPASTSNYFHLKNEFIKNMEALTSMEQESIWNLLFNRLGQLIKEEKQDI